MHTNPFHVLKQEVVHRFPKSLAKRFDVDRSGQKNHIPLAIVV